MTFSIEAFRRTEEILRAAALPADIICTLVALAQDHLPPYAETEDLERGASRFPLGVIADRLGCDRAAAALWLRSANTRCFESLGMMAVDLVSGRSGLDDETVDVDDLDELSEAVVVFGAAFLDIVRGTIVKRLGPTTLRPDTLTALSAKLLERFALCGGGNILYRHHLVSADRTADLHNAAALLAAAEPPAIDVLFYAPDASRLWSSAAALLAALLHAERPTILFLSSQVCEAPRQKDVPQYDYAEVDDDLGTSTLWHTLNVDGERLLPLMRAAPIVVVVAVPEDVRLHPAHAGHFATAIGPFKADRASLVEAFVETSNGRLTENAAQRLMTVWNGKAMHARSLLDATGRLVDADSRVSDKSRFSNQETYSDVAVGLADGLASMVWTPTPLRLLSGDDTFYKELFVCDPSVDELFSERLRGKNLRLLLLGPPGTGKSRAARAFSNEVLGRDCIALQPSDVMRYRLGETEQAIAKYFALAKKVGAALFIDEADSVAQNRATASIGAAHIVTAVTTSLLIELDNHQLPVIMASNVSEQGLDPAIRRRMDFIVEAKPLPEHLERRAIALLLKVDTPCSFTGFGGETVIADYAQAKKLAVMRGDTPEAMMLSVARARDNRLGRRPRRKIGF